MKPSQKNRKRVRLVASASPKLLKQYASGRGHSFGVKPQGVSNTYTHIAAGGDYSVITGGVAGVMTFDGGGRDLMPQAKRAINLVGGKALK